MAERGDRGLQVGRQDQRPGGSPVQPASGIGEHQVQQ
jgi:hypothetical protein